MSDADRRVRVCKVNGSWCVLAADTVGAITISEVTAYGSWAEALDAGLNWTSSLRPLERMVVVGP